MDLLHLNLRCPLHLINLINHNNSYKSVTFMNVELKFDLVVAESHPPQIRWRRPDHVRLLFKTLCGRQYIILIYLRKVYFFNVIEISTFCCLFTRLFKCLTSGCKCALDINRIMLNRQQRKVFSSSKWH